MDTPQSPKFTVASAAFEIQGRRPTMEDAHVVIDDFKKSEESLSSSQFQNLSFYAIYDGHGGDQIAKMVAEELHHVIAKSEKFIAGDVKAAFIESFAEVDKAVVEKCNQNSWMVGTTAVLGMIADGTLLVANVGDSEAAVVSIDGSTVSAQEMTTPHKATDQIEKSRIEALGGHVFLGRVFGSLAVTRAFGDSKFKTPKMSQNFVSVEPAIHELKLESKHKFIILACDGVWDVMNHSEAATFVNDKFNSGSSISSIAQDLTSEAFKKGSNDNISVVIVHLDWIGTNEEFNLARAWENFDLVATYEKSNVLDSIAKSYDEINIAESLSGTASDLGKIYDEMNVVESVSKAYDELDVAKSLSETASSVSKAYDELDVAKSLGDFVGSISSFFGDPSPAPRPTPAKKEAPNTGEVIL